MDPGQAIRELAAIVGPGNVLSSRAERTVYGYDASVFRGMELLAVVLPETAQQIVAPRDLVPAAPGALSGAWHGHWH